VSARLRVGLIGVGRLGRVYARDLATRIPETRLVHLADVNGEAAQTAARLEPELRRDYRRLAQRKHRAVAKVMVARKLAVRLYWMLREHQPYSPPPAVRMQESPSHSVVAP